MHRGFLLENEGHINRRLGWHRSLFPSFSSFPGKPETSNYPVSPIKRENSHQRENEFPFGLGVYVKDGRGKSRERW